MSHVAVPQIPRLHDLGEDLTRLTRVQQVWSLSRPFIALVGYFVCAMYGWWIPATGCVVYFSFCTYGSVSHDLVHRNMGLPRIVNEFFLTLIELLAFRSGHAYRQSHMHHHARFPHEDDVEAHAARLSFIRTLLDGVVHQHRLALWAIRNGRRHRGVIAAEVAAACVLFLLCIGSLHWTPVFAVYAALVTIGSWIIPLITVYIPHNPAGANVLTQTRRFRGKVLGLLALEHLYHLEHHMYPSVPHHHWPELAKRLDPYLEKAGIPATRLWF